MAYVYRHIRLDKNEPFYIGIGSDTGGFYKRAFSKTKRNNIWSRISCKTDYDVEILIDSVDWDYACEKEKEFIKIYGRINNNTGILSNLTDGGSGAAGIVIPKHIIERDIERKSIPIAKYDINGHFMQSYPSLRVASKSIGNGYLNFRNYKNEPVFLKGFYWKIYNGDNSNISISHVVEVKISSFNKNGDYIKTYNSKIEAAIDLGISKNAVYLLYTGRRKSTVNSIRLRVDNGNHSNIGVHEYVPNWKIKEYRVKKGSLNPMSKKVCKIDRQTNKIVSIHGSCRDAALNVGIKSKSQIAACCNGRIPSAGGFYWRYL